MSDAPNSVHHVLSEARLSQHTAAFDKCGVDTIEKLLQIEREEFIDKLGFNVPEIERLTAKLAQHTTAPETLSPAGAQCRAACHMDEDVDTAQPPAAVDAAPTTKRVRGPIEFSPAPKNSPDGAERTMSPVSDACVLCVSDGSCRRSNAGWRSRRT